MHPVLRRDFQRAISQARKCAYGNNASALICYRLFYFASENRAHGKRAEKFKCQVVLWSSHSDL